MSKKLQTILVPKSNFTQYAAIKWIKNNGYKAQKIDETENYYRFRQRPPIKGAEYYTIKLDNDVMLVYFA